MVRAIGLNPEKSIWSAMMNQNLKVAIFFLFFLSSLMSVPLDSIYVTSLSSISYCSNSDKKQVQNNRLKTLTLASPTHFLNWEQDWFGSNKCKSKA